MEDFLFTLTFDTFFLTNLLKISHLACFFARYTKFLTWMIKIYSKVELMYMNISIHKNFIHFSRSPENLKSYKQFKVSKSSVIMKVLLIKEIAMSLRRRITRFLCYVIVRMIRSESSNLF